MKNLVPNNNYIISWNNEPEFEATYLRKERGFFIFLMQGIELPIREQYLIVKKIAWMHARILIIYIIVHP